MSGTTNAAAIARWTKGSKLSTCTNLKQNIKYGKVEVFGELQT